ncbi:hypothetical protein IGK47_004740 [Enterococcus sp. AZ007]
MFDYDTAMADQESHAFVNVNQSTEQDSPRDMEGWNDEE